MTQRSITVMLQAVTGPYQAAMGRAAGATRGFATAAQSAGTNVRQQFTPGLSGATAKLVGGAGLAAGLKHAGDLLMSYDDALTGVSKTTGLTGDELSALGADLTGLSQEVEGSAEDMLGIAQAAAQLGVANDDIAEFTETVAGIASATDLTTEAAATDMARLANVMQLPIDDVGRLGSTIVDLGNNMATTEPEILSMATRIAAAGTNAGASAAEVLALAAAASSLGVEAEAGGTAISMTLNDINTQVATSGDNLQQFADLAGLSAAEFAESWREDPVAAFQLFLRGLEQVRAEGGSINGVLDSLNIKGARQQDILTRLAGGWELTGDAVDMANGAYADNVALADEVEAANARSSVAAENLTDRLDELVRTLARGEDGAEDMAAAFNAAGDAVGYVTGFVGDMDVFDRATGVMGVAATGARNFVNNLGDLLGLDSRVLSFSDSIDVLFGGGDGGATMDGFAAQADRYVGSLETMAASAADTATTSGQAADGIGDVGDAADDATGELVSLQEAVDGYVAAQRAASDPMLAAIRAGHELADAMTAADDGATALAEGDITQGEYDALILDAVEASRDLELALFEAGSSGADAEQEFREMAASAGLSQEATDRLLAIVRETGEAADHEFRDRSMEIDAQVDMSAFSALERRLSSIFGRPYRVNIQSSYTPPAVLSGRGSSSYRAAGGPVEAYRPYLVGESGPEMFAPTTPGTVIDATTTAAMLSPQTPAGPAPSQMTFAPSITVESRSTDPMWDAQVATRRLYAAIGG